MNQYIIKQLAVLVNKPAITLTESGDDAIKTVLKFVKTIGKTTVLIQDQGGWLTYKSYSLKEGLKVIELKTDHGIIDLVDLENKSCENSVLLLNSLTGYCAEQPMSQIAGICLQKKCFFVNDASGSIGTDIAKIGDVILGSFGKHKPITLNYGGFIAGQQLFEGSFNTAYDLELFTKLQQLPERRKFLLNIHVRIKTDLKQYKIIHLDKKGINVIVKFNNEQEKQDIIAYCASNRYSYTLCPRYIRVNENAISIEVKQLK